MRNNIYVQSVLVWIIMAFVTILFAVFREAIFIPATELSGTVARALLLPAAMLYIFVIAYLFFKTTKAKYTMKDALRIGIIWLVLTIAFEFTFGSIVMGNSLSALVADYNLLAGRTWSLFLFTLLVAPLIVARYLLKRPAK